MITDFSVNVKFTGQFDDRIDGHYGHTGGFVNLPGCGFTYGTLSKVKEEAKRKAQSFVDTAVRNTENRERLVISTKDGHVLIVMYDDGWFYAIANNGRESNYAGSCTVSDDFKGACDAARNHADQCFGGVYWEKRF